MRKGCERDQSGIAIAMVVLLHKGEENDDAFKCVGTETIVRERCKTEVNIWIENDIIEYRKVQAALGSEMEISSGSFI